MVRFISGRLIFGLAILLVGLVLLLNNMGLNIDLDIRQLLSYWPVIPLLFGLNWLFLSFGSTKAEEGKKVFFSWSLFTTALIAIAVGVVFLGRNLGLFQVDTRLFWNLLWPFVLILIGINLLRGRTVSGGKGGRFAFMGGSNVGGAQPWNLESGSYFALMGGLEIDLTSAILAEGETILDLTAIMGGIDVKIPREMAVVYDGSAVLGGVTFKEQEDGGIIGGRRIEANITPETERIVRIQARAIMGGIDIKEV